MPTRLPIELDRLVREALAEGASDVFLVPGEPLSMRLGGVIRRLESGPLDAESVRAMAEEAIGAENVAAVGPKVGCFRQWCGSPGEHNTSICVARSHGDCTIALRIMPTRIFSVEEVKAPRAMIDAVEAPYGLAVTSGLTGSGKTTLAYALVDHLNATAEGRHICTVEEPSHILIPAKKALVQQREVGVDAPDVLSGIQASVDQDLDILYVGEVDSAEVLQACISIAETGHMVITQMHASTPEDAITRMIDMFPDATRDLSRKALAHVLRGVSAQLLIPTADGKGRVAAYGVLVPDAEMRQSIAEGRDFMTRHTPWSGARQTIQEHVERLLAEGVVNEEAATDAFLQLDECS